MSRDSQNEPIQSKQEALQWLAFCYVADELNEQDRNEFELRLEDDHEAREAVVDAMQQAELIWLACDTSNSQTREKSVRLAAKSKTRLTRSAALLASAAALLLMVASWGWFANQETPANTGLSESENLAVALAELVEDARDDYVIADGFEEIEFDDQDSFEEDDMSDWMFVALTDEGAEL